MSFFPNSSRADVRGGTFTNVGRDQIYNFGNKKPDLNDILAPVIGAGYDRSGPVSSCYSGTREDIIAEIKRRVDGDRDHPICWLTGPAGSGKSAISQTVTQWYADNRRLLANFFFLRGAGDRSVIARLIPTLSHQLSLSVPATKPLIQGVIESEPYITRKPLRYQFHKLVIEPIATAYKAKRSLIKDLFIKSTSTLPHRKQKQPQTTVIVIDALDECNDKDLMAEFIEILIDAFKANPGLPFHVLITSRIEEHIRKKLEIPSARSTVRQLSLQDFDASHDIHKFFRSGFATIYEENARVMRNVPSPWPSDSDLSSLVKKCDGSFIFAVTLMDFIRTGRGLPQDIFKKALMAKAGLDALYKQVLSDAPLDHNFERILGTLMLLTSPLSIAFLAQLLRLRAEDIVLTLLGIQSILMIPGDDDQPIRLLHTSLHDFLMSQPRSGGFFIDPPTRHFHIAIDCLAILRMHPEGDIFYGGGQEYACLNWCHHLQQSLIDGGDDIVMHSLEASLMRALKCFSDHSLEFWVNTVLANAYDEQTVITLDSLLLVLKQSAKSSPESLQVLNGVQNYIKV